MNKSNIIEHHTYAVQVRKNLAPLAAGEQFLPIDKPRPDAKRLKKIDLEISILGQIHNPRISAKSRAALNLN